MREHVTIHRGTVTGSGVTRVGADCLLMAVVHVAHDCAVADNAVLANGALLAGHVSVGAYSFLGGGSAVHQFCRIGESVMVAGHASITRDVPPFVMVAERDDVIGFNVVGLRRRGFSRDVMKELKRLFHEVFFTPGNIRAVAVDLQARPEPVSPEAARFLEFFTAGQRSFARPRRRLNEGEGDAG